MRRLALLLLLLPFVGCQRAYYAAMEKVGVEKREILVDRVGEARDAQEEAKEQFETTLDAFKAVTGFDGGALEDQYRTLDASFQRSRARADDVRDRIDAIDSVARALFAEWEAELGQYEDRSLRARSEQQLRETRRRYEAMLAAMERAERAMAPVLSAFNDQVLFLKHNLNAQAIASLDAEVASIEAEVAGLIRDMEASIAEADRFILQLQG